MEHDKFPFHKKNIGTRTVLSLKRTLHDPPNGWGTRATRTFYGGAWRVFVWSGCHKDNNLNNLKIRRSREQAVKYTKNEENLRDGKENGGI